MHGANWNAYVCTVRRCKPVDHVWFQTLTATTMIGVTARDLAATIDSQPSLFARVASRSRSCYYQL